MSISIPVWVLWALGITGGIIAVFILTIILSFAWMGFVCARAVGKGINW